MPTIRIKAYVVASPSYADPSVLDYGVYPFEWNDGDKVTVKEIEIEVDLDHADIRPQLVKNLREQQSAIRAKAEREANQIEGRIQSLLCIEHKSTEGEPA